VTGRYRCIDGENAGQNSECSNFIVYHGCRGGPPLHNYDALAIESPSSRLGEKSLQPWGARDEPEIVSYAISRSIR